MASAGTPPLRSRVFSSDAVAYPGYEKTYIAMRSVTHAYRSAMRVLSIRPTRGTTNYEGDGGLHALDEGSATIERRWDLRNNVAGGPAVVF
jgi:hypothetical protein